MRDVIITSRAPKPIGPYSQAIRAGGFLFVSGQVAIDPDTGQMVEGDIEQQTARVLENLKNILEAAGSSLEAVVKTTVYLKDMGEFSRMNAVYARAFTHEPPARSTVEVARLPRDCKVEIDVIALA